MAQSLPLPPRLELWRHRTREDRYLVLVRGTGVHRAAGQVGDIDMLATRQDVDILPWSAVLGAEIEAHAVEYEVLWPPGATGARRHAS